MIKNQSGFISKKYPLQPDYYKNCFHSWCAVFIDSQDNEYHLQLNLDFYAHQDGNSHAKSISILRQTKTGRVDVTMKEFKSIKSAMEQLEKFLIKEERTA